VTLKEAVEQIANAQGFRVDDGFNRAFNDRQFVKSLPSPDRPWDEALEQLLKPYNLEFKLEMQVVYVGRDITECLGLTDMSSVTSMVQWGHGRCEQAKYEAKHPQPLPTNPWDRCMKLREKNGKAMPSTPLSAT
jgi:hypothetical protein